jgi:pimeloyl-ACP methyl ester carboxylesterase
MSYQPKHHAEQLTVPVRSLKYRIHRWGNAAAEPVFLLHGWADTGMSFQFVADTLAAHWCLIAPDWRGFGDTDWNPEGYWIPDYLADLDILMDHFAPAGKVRLVGHSMGGNIVCLYAGVCPDRVSHVVSLDQYGLQDSDPAAAPERYARWLQDWRDTPRNNTYEDITPLIKRLRSLAPHLAQQQAQWLAQFWSKTDAAGRVISKIDPGHKRINPVLYRREEARACWRRVTAHALVVRGEESRIIERYTDQALRTDFKRCFKSLEEVAIAHCGHMMHLDQPEQLAGILDNFLRK